MASMESQGRASRVKPARGWITTGQAAEQLGITIPTVKAWILRGALVGRQVGDRWWVSRESVEEVLGFGPLEHWDRRGVQPGQDRDGPLW